MRINLHWKGPHSLDEVRAMEEADDYGIYQYYGAHPVYGADTLVYLGKANGQTFGSRFRQAEYNWTGEQDGWENNEARIRIHTGRIHVTRQEKLPGIHKWGKWIDQAEYLLICAHSPAWNGQYVRNRPNSPSYDDVHVLNWGQYGRLLPEVSGARFTNGAVFTRLNDDPLVDS